MPDSSSTDAYDPSSWRTYLVTGQSLSAGRTTADIVEAAIDGGVDVVQLRDKDADVRTRYERGHIVRELTEAAGIPLLVNDRVDLAMAIDADGVHVGQSDLPVAVARDLLGPDAIVGCSAWRVEDATRAERDGADYLGTGTVYGTSSKDVKPEKDGIGPEGVARVVEAVSIPVFAIGGITADNAGPVVEAGATGVAVISEITSADDPTRATERLHRAIRRTPASVETMHERTADFCERAAERYALDPDVLEFPEGTKTAADAAEAIGCDVAQIASSLVFEADDDLVVVVTSGANRVSEEALATHVDTTASQISMADPAVVKETLGWAIGGVPPICHDESVPVVVDETLLDHEEVWAAAGTPQAVFPIDPDRLVTLAEAEPVSVTG